MPNLNPIHYVLLTLLALLSVYVYFTHDELLEARKSISAYESAIMYQNSEIESERVNKRKAENQLENWKALPAKVKWKTLIKKIYADVNQTKERTCENNEIIERNTYSLDWNNF